MTSNMGSDTILENFEDLLSVGEEHREEIIETTKVEVFDVLKESLRPEFLNRIDEKIMFLPLTKDEIKLIAKILMRKLTKNLAKQEMNIELTDTAMDLLSDLGYDPQFGARPLKRVIQRELVNPLSVKLLSGEFGPGDTIYVGTDKKGFVFSENEVKSKDKPKTEKPKAKKKSDVDKLNKATKDLNDELENFKAEDN